MKVRGNKRLQCGESVNDPKTIEEVMKLINEFLRRVEKHKGVLLSESVTPFDKTINELDTWLTSMEEKAKENNDPTIAELRKAMIEAAKKMIELVRQAREKWLRTYRRELEELIEKLRRGEATIIMRGEPFNENESFIIYIYTEHLTIRMHKMAKEKGITMAIALKKLKGIHVITPNTLKNNISKAIRYGLLLTDGSVIQNRPEMSTVYLWQSIIWALAWSNKVYIHIDNVNINNDIKVKLCLVSINNKVKDKIKIVRKILNMNEKDFLIFLLAAVFGDGNIDIEKRRVRLTIGDSKYETWGNITKRLRECGFDEDDKKDVKVFEIRSFKAVALAQRWLNNQEVATIIKDLSALPDGEKLRNLIMLANIRVKQKGRWSISIIDSISMNVHVRQDGSVELRTNRKSFEDAKAIWEKLRGANYEAELSKQGKKFVVYMNMSTIKKYPELVIKVCEVLKRMREEATKAMRRLNCPAQGPWA
ncbi:hypothetical protein [Vulcanisaeta distributa]|uniref:hypothetical protein n=1 Tax=Vulcanisaeta distributa TaxID=164451 RepID=UPI001FE1F287|nr:hypothetical protein [Vulcanisaeta distributa]